MRNTKKKGFTIVELVVVVAVIAILAAVLIPTFSGIIKKARLNADEQTVANMNKYVAAAAAEEEFVFAADAVNALYDNGFNIGKFETFSKGYHYAYDFENNEFYLLDATGAITYPEKAKGVEISKLWGFFNNEKSDKIEGVTKYIALSAITDSKLFNEKDCVFSGTGTYTIDLNGKAITVDAGGKSIKLLNGSVLTDAKNLDTDPDNDVDNDVASSYDISDKSVVPKAAATNGTLTDPNVVKIEKGVTTVENLIFTGTSPLVLKDFATAGKEVVFKNCAFDLSNTADSSIQIRTAESYEFINCTFSFKSANVFVCGNANKPDVTIKNCTFTSGRGLVIQPKGTGDTAQYGDILIEGNTFIDNGTAEGKPSIQFASADGKPFEAKSITIKNNDFLCKDIAIRIHTSLTAMDCDKIVISGNSFVDGVVKIDGDENAASQAIADAWASKFE